MKSKHRLPEVGLLGAPALAAMLTVCTAVAQTPSNAPLVLPSALPPNIVLTLDNSQNMRRAFAPDTLMAETDVSIAGSRRFKSATFNPLAYNPSVTYTAPAGAGTTTFLNARVHGFNPARGTINLANGYRPFLYYDPADSSGALPTGGFAPHVADPLSSQGIADFATLGVIAADQPAPAYYASYNSSCGDINNDGCYQIVLIGTDPVAQQNFANWFSFYRTRHLTMVSALWRAVDQAGLTGTKTRIGWQVTEGSACTSLETAGTACVYLDAAGGTVLPAKSNLVQEFRVQSTPTAIDRPEDLRQWLRGVGAYGGSIEGSPSLRTALRRSGEYFRRSSFPNNPYAADDPLASSGAELACRPNFNVVLAGAGTGDSDNDPYCSGSACGNQDGTAQSVPVPADSQSIFAGITSYTPRGPYQDGNSNSLADLAFHYWRTDLRTNLSNILLPYLPDRTGVNAVAQFWAPKNDPASWQHMVNFVVGVGLSRGLSGQPAWNPTDLDPSSYNSLSGTTVWPMALGAQERLFDLWHAAVNSRGQFFDAASPDQLAAALQTTLQRTIDRSNVGAAIATNSSRLTTESTLYQASFSSVDWSGNVRAIDVNRDGSLGVDQWNADISVPAPSTRRIFTHTGSAPIPFSSAALTTAGILSRFGAIGDGPPSTAEKVVEYLRGVRTNEGTGSGQLRPRGSVLGDFVNSDIIFAAQDDFGYKELPESNDNLTTTTVDESYVTFVRNKVCATNCSSRPSKMLYVGGNDGMLHGFNADTGTEVFAYVPRGVLMQDAGPSDTRSKLALLAEGSYNANHRFFVDGSPWIGDACLTPYNSATPQCTSWATILVGVLGAGGKGVFALNVSVNPAGDWSTTLNGFDQTRVLWDLDASSDPNLGYTMGQPVVGRLRDGEFYAIFGNGYDSANRCAVLYLVRLRDGFVRRLSTTESNLTNSCAASPNGLGRPSLLDEASLPGTTVGDRITDFVYAADLQGNVWRFNLKGVTTSTFPTNNSVSRNMFVAARYGNNNCSSGMVRQRITGGIEIGRGPVGRTGQGNDISTRTAMLYFGTGSFFQDGDQTDTSRQTFYGLVDDLSGNATTTPQANRCALRERTINVSTRSFAANEPTITYFNNSGNLQSTVGFYMDLPEGGSSGVPSERVVTMPLILPNRIIFASLVPNSDVCTGGGTSVIQAMDPLQGYSVRSRPEGSTIQSIFINSGGDGVRAISGFIKNLVAIDAGTRVYLYYGTSTGQVQKVDTTALTETGSAGRGRTSWREVTGQQRAF